MFVCANHLLLFEVSNGHMSVSWSTVLFFHTLVVNQNLVGWLLAYASFIKAHPTRCYLESEWTSGIHENSPKDKYSIITHSITFFIDFMILQSPCMLSLFIFSYIALFSGSMGTNQIRYHWIHLLEFTFQDDQIR